MPYAAVVLVTLAAFVGAGLLGAVIGFWRGWHEATDAWMEWYLPANQ